MALRDLGGGVREVVLRQDFNRPPLTESLLLAVGVGLRLAPLWRQLLDDLIDAGAVFGYLALTSAHVGRDNQLPQGYAYGFLALLVVYFVGWRFGSTPGMLVARIRPIADSGAAGMSGRQAALRAALWFFLIVPLGAEYAVRLLTRRRRGWIDRLCGTAVITRGRRVAPAGTAA